MSLGMCAPRPALAGIRAFDILADAGKVISIDLDCAGPGAAWTPNTVGMGKDGGEHTDV